MAVKNPNDMLGRASDNFKSFSGVQNLLNNLEVICQDWTEHEYEDGWGATQRPDGVSLHLSNKFLNGYLDLNWNNRDMSKVPNFYMSPSGIPYVVRVSEKLYEEIKSDESKSLRFYRQDEKDLYKSGDIFKLNDWRNY